MPVSGYDPDDIEAQLGAALLAGDLEPYLSVEDLERYAAGERLAEMLSDEEITRAVGPADAGE